MTVYAPKNIMPTCIDGMAPTIENPLLALSMLLDEQEYKNMDKQNLLEAENRKRQEKFNEKIVANIIAEGKSSYKAAYMGVAVSVALTTVFTVGSMCSMGMQQKRLNTNRSRQITSQKEGVGAACTDSALGASTAKDITNSKLSIEHLKEQRANIKSGKWQMGRDFSNAFNQISSQVGNTVQSAWNMDTCTIKAEKQREEYGMETTRSDMRRLQDNAAWLSQRKDKTQQDIATATKEFLNTWQNSIKI